MRRYCLLLLLAIVPCNRSNAQSSGLPFNWGWANGPYGGHVFRIATLVQNFNSGAADHLHIVAIANYNDYSGANATIDATFANRGSFAASYTVRGAPVTYNAHLAAYQDSVGSVEIYFIFASTYVSGSYTVLENFQESVETNPPDLGDVTPPGTLVWDSANPADTQHYIGFNGNTGIGTQSPTGELSISTANPGSETGAHIANTDPTGYSVLRLSSADTSDVNVSGLAIHSFNSAWSQDPASAIAPSSSSLISWDPGGLTFDTIAAAPLRFFTSGAASGNERMRIDPAGNVGIGTTTPSATLEVNGNMKADGNFIYVGAGGGAVYGDGGNTVVQAPVGGNVYLANVGVDGTKVSQSDGSLRIGGPSQPNAGIIFPNGKQTVAYTGGSALTSASNGNVGIGTTSPGSPLSVNGGISVGAAYAGAAAPANGAIFQGNVGIGTNSPSSSLDVVGTIRSSVGVVGTSATTAFMIEGGNGYSPGGSQNINWVQNNGGLQLGKFGLAFDGTNMNFVFSQMYNAGSTSGEIMRVGGNGNVGIGTSSPGSKLDVRGDIQLSGSIVFPDGSRLGAAPSTASLTSLGTVTSGVWNATPLNAAYLPSTVVYADSTQTITGQKSFSGNVGIGTNTPGADLTGLPSPPPPTTPILEVNGDIAFTQGPPGVNPKQNLGGSLIFADQTVQSTAWNGTTLGGDYAESVDVVGERESYEPGDVITIDATSPGNFCKSAHAYSRLVAGVFSMKPGLVGRRTTTSRINKEEEVPMAMIGIVPTKVTTENGSIEPGDTLVTSNTPGYAMKGTDGARLQGAVVGKALAPLARGSGMIEVLVLLQ